MILFCFLLVLVASKCRVECSLEDANATATGAPKLRLSVDGEWDAACAREAGACEGRLTASLVAAAAANWRASNGGGLAAHAKAAAFVETQRKWLQIQVAANPQSEYWRAAGAWLAYFAGMADAVRAAEPSVSLLDIVALTWAGDLEDILSAFGEAPRVNRHYALGSCSGLVRLTASGRVLAAHTTFNDYQFMLRLFRLLSINQRTVGYSSRPGDVESKDDFYVVGAAGGVAFAALETSLTVFNRALYSALSPATAPAWLRAMIANALATTASAWVETFALHNSGTHNAQWLVTELSTPTIVMYEQMVAVTETRDVTGMLRAAGFVPSFNVPYCARTFNASGYGAHGFSWQNDARHRIFRRDAPRVQSTADALALMTQNNWPRDPLSPDPCTAISARCDLMPRPAAFGGIDVKTVDAALWSDASFYIQSSPTHSVQPVFAFNGSFAAVPHAGMPVAWPFAVHLFKR